MRELKKVDITIEMAPKYVKYECPLGWNQRWKAYRIAKKRRKAEYKEFFPERSEGE